MRPIVLWLGAAACSGALRGTGVPDLADVDADGFLVADGDCDDADPAVHPFAVDAPGDGADTDCDGLDAEAWPIAALRPGDLLITEFLADPVGIPSALGEWLEVRNTRDEAVDLEGLVLRDAGTDDVTVTASLVVPPGGVAVLGGGADPETNGGAPVDVAWGGEFGLSNAEDAVALTVGDTVLDAVAWDPTWPLAPGRSTLRDPDDDRWCLAEDEGPPYGVGGWGSPGADNPRCPPPFTGVTLAEVVPGDVVITELMSDPAQVDGDHGEWLELHGLRGDDIDLFGLGLETDDGDDVTVDEHVVLPAHGYVVLGAFTEPQLNGGAPVAWAWRWSFGLSNAGETVRVRYGTRVLDEVAYDPTFPDDEGASKSLDPGEADPARNDDAGAWCAATRPYGAGDLGTPGAENPPCP